VKTPIIGQNADPAAVAHAQLPQPQDEAPAASAPATTPSPDSRAPEVGGRGGLDPVRYGDWEKNGRCIDF